VTAQVTQSIRDVISEYSGLSRQVLEYCLATKRLVDESKEPGFSVESLAALAEFAAVDEFERVGNFKEVMTWAHYAAFLAAWMPTAEWDCSFRRITEASNRVFLELEEHAGVGDARRSVNSTSIYEFDDTGKIRHLDVYLQMPMPSGQLPSSYAGEAS
jgi:hypothetical protein